MIRWETISAWLLCAWVSSFAGAQSEVVDAVLSRKLAGLLDHLPESGVSVSAVVVDAADGRVIYERDGNQPLIPASTQKILVMAVAIDQLSAEFEFATRMGMIGPNLVVIGDGDPGFGDPRLAEAAGEEITTVFDRWAEALIKRGIRRVPGDLILDESIFDRQGTHSSWERVDLPRWYAAPVGALNINDNCLDFTVWPDDVLGARAHWSVMPPNDVARVVNLVTSSSRGTPIVHRPGDEFEFRLSGKCSRRGTLQSVSVPDPGLLFASALRTHFRERGIEIEGELIRPAEPIRFSEFQLVAEHRTPLSGVLGRIGHNSQNLFAECLMKRLGYEWSKSMGRPDAVGSWETGRLALVDGLHRLGVSGTSLRIADGSGLSRNNRASASDMVQIMLKMVQHSRKGLFLSSLSGTESEGRLARRFGRVKGSIFAKTGTMRGVRAIVGYVESESRGNYCFALIFNKIKGKSIPFNNLIVKTCEFLGS